MYLPGIRCVSRSYLSSPEADCTLLLPQGHDESESSDFMAECDGCHAWQHGTCMGFATPSAVPTLYFCEKCRPDLYPDLIRCVSLSDLPCEADPAATTPRKHAKRMRQNSIASHANPSRSSRSHSPTYLIKQPPKRRNTMNSRDAAYELEIQSLLVATAAEASMQEAARDGTGKDQVVASPATISGQAPDSREGDVVPEPEPEIVSSRRKRKRSDDERCVVVPRLEPRPHLKPRHASAALRRNARDPRR